MEDVYKFVFERLVDFTMWVHLTFDISGFDIVIGILAIIILGNLIARVVKSG